jgi:hypothetical protein
MGITDPLDPSPPNFHFREFILEHEDLSFASGTISWALHTEQHDQTLLM